MNWLNTTKQKIWKLLYPVFPYFEKTAVVFHKKERQRFFIGYIAQGKTVADVKRHLASQGFGNHFVAWEDSDQVLSWRKLVNFSEQYHLRIYNDGEIRGHFELTPEASPVKHFLEKGEEDRCTDFMKFLGDCVTTKKHLVHLEPDTTVPTPDSEITFESKS